MLLFCSIFIYLMYIDSVKKYIKNKKNLIITELEIFICIYMCIYVDMINGQMAQQFWLIIVNYDLQVSGMVLS